jgi:hypothetical protein
VVPQPAALRFGMVLRQLVLDVLLDLAYGASEGR